MLKRKYKFLFMLAFSGLIAFVVVITAIIAALNTESKGEAAKIRQQMAEEAQEDYDFQEDITFKVSITGGKATTSVYGAGWGVEDIKGSSSGVSWTGYSSGGDTTIYASQDKEVNGEVQYLKKGKKKWNLRGQARKAGLKGYGASQGVTTDGAHLYVAYSKGSDNNAKKVAKIAKYSLGTKTLIGVSPKAYHLGHVNDLAYDRSTRTLISVFSQAGSKKLFVDLLDPGSLKYIRRQKIKIPASVKGLKRKQIKRITSFSGVDVDNADNEVYLRCRNTNIVLVVDGETFVAKRGYTLDKRPTGTDTQGLTMDGIIMYRSHAKGQSSSKNIVDVLDSNGKLQKRIKIKATGELEGLYITGGSLCGIIFCKPGSAAGKTYAFRIGVSNKGGRQTVYKPKNEKEKNAYTVWQHLKSLGCTDEAAGGVIGNVSVESASTFDPMIIQGGARGTTMTPGKGYGICQWTSKGRQQGLRNYAKKRRQKYWTIEAQAGWLGREMSTQFVPTSGYQYTGKTFKRISNLTRATKAFCYEWERPGIPHIESRIKAAKKWYKLFKGSSARVVQGKVSLTGSVSKIREGRKVRYYAHFEGTLDGVEIVGSKEIRKSQYLTFKRTGRITVTGSGLYGIDVSWKDVLSGGSGVQGALAFGKKICSDNRYYYSQGACHTCGKPGYHYVCTTFVVACYAHGAGDKDMLKHCKAQDIMMVHSSYVPYLRRSSSWRELGAAPISRLRPGDVIVWEGHTEIYYGNGKRMGAHNLDTYSKAGSISITNMYGGYKTVFRYKGG